jgi:hypothetical protein
MGGERSRQGCNVSLHVAGPVSSRFAYIYGTATRKYRLCLSAMLGVVSVELLN